MLTFYEDNDFRQSYFMDTYYQGMRRKLKKTNFAADIMEDQEQKPVDLIYSRLTSLNLTCVLVHKSSGE